MQCSAVQCSGLYWVRSVEGPEQGCSITGKFPHDTTHDTRLKNPDTSDTSDTADTAVKMMAKIPISKTADWPRRPAGGDGQHGAGHVGEGGEEGLQGVEEEHDVLAAQGGQGQVPHLPVQH